jgi:hypothetical protein
MSFKDKSVNSYIYSSIAIELEGFNLYNVEEGFLYVHENAEYEVRTNEVGRAEVLLIGIKFNIHASALNLCDIRDHTDVYRALDGWTGRFTLFAFGRFYNDACGLKHIYYGRVNNILIITSSLTLVLSNFRLEKHNLADLLCLEHPMNWIPTPLTKYNGFYQLLPSSSIGTDLSIECRTIFYAINDLKNLSIENIVNKINNICLYIAHKICLDKRPKFLALTGGHDSRTLYAYFKNACKDFKTILIDHSKIHIWDIIAFKRINKTYKQENIFVKRYENNFSQLRLDEFDSNCDHCCKEEDRFFYAYNQLNTPTEALMLRANVSSEILRKKNYEKLSESIDSSNELIYQLEKKYGRIDDFKKLALEHWYNVRLLNDKKNRTIDWRILFWLDQRSSAWVGSIDEATEVTNFKYINPLNSSLLLNLFYVLSIQNTDKRDFQEYLINEIDPKLLNMEFNKSTFFLTKNIYIRNFSRYFLRKFWV